MHSHRNGRDPVGTAVVVVSSLKIKDGQSSTKLVEVTVRRHGATGVLHLYRVIFKAMVWKPSQVSSGRRDAVSPAILTLMEGRKW